VRPFQNESIKTKLSSMIMIICIAALSLSCATFRVYDRVNSRRAMLPLK